MSIFLSNTLPWRSAHKTSLLFSEEPAFRLDKVRDMDGWLKRHAVFITAIAGALYESECDTHLLAQTSSPRPPPHRWSAGRLGCPGSQGGGSCALGATDDYVLGSSATVSNVLEPASPLLVETSTLRGTRGMLQLAEMASLAHSVRGSLRENEAPNLRRLLASIDAWQRSFSSSNSGARA